MTDDQAAAPSPDPQSALSGLDQRNSGPRAVLRAIDAKTRPDLKRAIPGAVITLLCFQFGDSLGGIKRTTPGIFHLFGNAVEVPTPYVKLLVLGAALVYVVAGLVTTRSVARECGRISQYRAGPAAVGAVKLVCDVAGAGLLGLGLLDLLRVNLGTFLVGGVVTGVVVGIAAQQTMGNFFAGLVLMFARPFVAGQRVTIHSGALGGPFEGVIAGTGLIYTTITTAEGAVHLPNSGVLGAAVGPTARAESQPPPVPQPASPSHPG
ncbi:MAG: mechanosensitive ion channel family protein [Actinomycetota bacterium]|nr:mechanosensitive ion channel family protein [Actinomycetota bacterium]